MSDQIVLDCESFESALQSLSLIFQTSSTTLIEHLSNHVIDSYFEENPHFPYDFSDYLYERVAGQFGTPKLLDAVCWFHLTRVVENTSFAEGIQPLGAILPRLQTILVDLVDDDLVKTALCTALDQGRIDEFLYHFKTDDPLHWGPFAILVRDVAFHAKEQSQHDYLAMPEIIEDICSGFHKSEGVDLLPLFTAKLKPTIVKFSSSIDGELDKRCIASALCYVRSHMLQGRPDGNAICCFDGMNEPVPHSDILSVQLVC